MRRSFTIASIAAVSALSLNAQSFKVFTKAGETVGFNNEAVERIEFSMTSLPDEPTPPETHVIDFNEYMTSLKPEEGIMDLVANPKGLGHISISMKGSYVENTEEEHFITLGNSEGVVFSRKPTDEGMKLYRDVLANTTEFVYDFAVDGYLTPGNYHLSIPEGTYIDTKGNPLGGKICIYIMEAPAPEQNYTITPEPGIVETLPEITVKFDNYKFVEPLATLKAYVKKADSAYPDLVVPTIAEDGTITISFSPALSVPGIYNITIPAGILSLREEADSKSYMNKEISLVYEIEGSKQQPPKVGDFYYSDGSWSSFLVNRPDADPIGVVFYVGAATEFGDKESYYKVKDGSSAMPEFHGYVVALRDATYYDDEHHSVAWSFYNGWDDGCSCSVSTSDFLGYNNTVAIRARANKDFNGLSGESTNFPATYYATDFFDSQIPAPAQSSGWFLPSAYQLKYIYDRVYFIPNGGDSESACVQRSLEQLESVGGMPMYTRDSEYWSSTEQYDSSGCSYRAYYTSFDESSFNPGFITWSNKNSNNRVRSILAF